MPGGGLGCTLTVPAGRTGTYQRTVRNTVRTLNISGILYPGVRDPLSHLPRRGDPGYTTYSTVPLPLRATVRWGLARGDRQYL